MRRGAEARGLALALVAAALAVCAAIPADGRTVDQIPDPSQDQQACGLRQSIGTPRMVCNPDAVLTPTGMEEVERILATLDASRATCPFASDGSSKRVPIEFAVLVVRKMHVPDRLLIRQEDVVNYARAVHDRWELGDPDCKTGLLLLVSREDHKAYIYAGRGARPYLSERKGEKAVESGRMMLWTGDDDKAVTLIARAAAKRVLARAVRDAGGSVGRHLADTMDWITDHPSLMAAAVLSGAVLGAVAFGVWSTAARAREGQRRARVERLLCDLQGLRCDAAYQAASCPLCLEEFEEVEAEEGDVEGSGPPPDDGTCYLGCGHRFHRPCATDWLQRRSQCPVCREGAEDMLGTPRQRRASGPHQEANIFFDGALEKLRRANPDLVSAGVVEDWWRHDGRLPAVYQPILVGARAAGPGPGAHSRAERAPRTTPVSYSTFSQSRR